jgi:hypothetical protein
MLSDLAMTFIVLTTPLPFQLSIDAVSSSLPKPPITQLDLVFRLGLQKMKVNQSIVSEVENGTRPVYDYEISKIATALKVSVGWLLKAENGSVSNRCVQLAVN